MNILLTNDDGIHARGIQSLKKALLKKHTVFVVAPHIENSGVSQAITLKLPLRAFEISKNEYAITGTPTDCVCIALNGLIKEKIDLVVSGINNGANIGQDISYSGTVAAVREAHLAKYKTIAFSLENDGENIYFDEYAEIASKIIDSCNKKNLLSIENILNVNFPKIKPDNNTPFKITTLGKSSFSSRLIEREDPAGNKYYWLSYERFPGNDEDTDVYCYHNNIISITPLSVNFFNEKFYPKLKNNESSIKEDLF